MNIDSMPNESERASVTISLSVRNLRQLLADAESQLGHASLFRQTSRGLLMVYVEPDALHYGRSNR